MLVLVLVPFPVQAHVKWFANFSFADLPLTIGEVITPTFLSLVGLSFAALAVLVLVERVMSVREWYRRFSDWFTERRTASHLILRVGMGATLLMAWQTNSLLVPRLPIEQAWIGWFQFLLIFLLFFRRTTQFAGWGIGFLYVIGFVQFSWFYMLDYLIFAGVATYFIVVDHPRDEIKGAALPALYFTTGFSLFWVGLEKLFYPQWGLFILQGNPQLALGLPIDFFLVGAAFIELVLGYLLIIGLLERPLSLVVTLVFFTTTLVFGKVEVIGHTIVHAALIVFLLEGPGSFYKPPVAIHKRTIIRMAFASVNFLLLLILLMLPYHWGGERLYEHSATEALERAENTVEFVPLEQFPPEVDFSVTYNPATAWLVNVSTDNFTFAPEGATENVMGRGHAYLYRDEQLIGVLYGESYQLRRIEPGTYTFTVSLHANDGSVYVVDGDPVSVTREIMIEPPP